MRARFAALVIAGGLIVGGDVHARAARTPCLGRFAIASVAVPSLADAKVLDVAAGAVTLDVCGTTTVKLRAKRRATTFRARWADCPGLGRVTLNGRIASPGCDALSGSVKVSGAKRARLDATLIACGNGRLDPGEACDETAAGGTCGAGCDACACVGPTTSTAPPDSTSSTTVIATTTTTTTTSSTTTSTSPDGPPIVAPDGVWTWVDFPDAACDDGSATGIGVNLAASPNVMILLGFGGACWDATTCWVSNTAAHGPFDGDHFAAAVPFFTDSILDRTLEGNPFADWNIAVVPYCTGDLHGGDNVVLYDTGTSTHLHHHAGHANLRAFLRRLGTTVPDAEKVVLAGVSAGGFGAVFGFPNVRARWPSAQLYLIDDSGPLLAPPAHAPAVRDAWLANWRLDRVTDPACGEPCRTDLSLLLPALAMSYPDTRIGLVSTVQDDAIATVYGITGAAFESALFDLAENRLDPTDNARYFFIGGNAHAPMLMPSGVIEDGVFLLDWITQLVSDDPAWTSVVPPAP
jgi:hypothetical protein